MAMLYPAHEDVKFCMECSRAAGVVLCSSRYFIRTLSLKAPLAPKKKLGIRRERVLFVLTEDIVCVITDGRKDPTRLLRYVQSDGGYYPTHANEK